mgnify:CR=1 FL=1
MKISAFPALFLIATLTACNSVAVYEPIVDTSNIEDPQQYEVDYAACEDITNRVDYSDEKTKAALKGGALGFGVVGAGVATTLAAGGVVLLPVAAPIYLAATYFGGKASTGKVDAELQEMRATVWNNCLQDKRNKDFSEKK